MKKKSKKDYLKLNLLGALVLGVVVILTVSVAQTQQNLQQEASSGRKSFNLPSFSSGDRGRDNHKVSPSPAGHCSAISCSTCKQQGKSTLCLDSESKTAYCGDSDVAGQSESASCISCGESEPHATPAPVH
jgi:hypothetical protein